VECKFVVRALQVGKKKWVGRKRGAEEEERKKVKDLSSWLPEKNPHEGNVSN